MIQVLCQSRLKEECRTACCMRPSVVRHLRLFLMIIIVLVRFRPVRNLSQARICVVLSMVAPMTQIILRTPLGSTGARPVRLPLHPPRLERNCTLLLMICRLLSMRFALPLQQSSASAMKYLVARV